MRYSIEPKEATGVSIGNKIADKITSISKKPSNNNNDAYIPDAYKEI